MNTKLLPPQEQHFTIADPTPYNLFNQLSCQHNSLNTIPSSIRLTYHPKWVRNESAKIVVLTFKEATGIGGRMANIFPDIWGEERTERHSPFCKRNERGRESEVVVGRRSVALSVRCYSVWHAVGSNGYGVRRLWIGRYCMWS